MEDAAKEKQFDKNAFNYELNKSEKDKLVDFFNLLIKVDQRLKREVRQNGNT